MFFKNMHVVKVHCFLFTVGYGVILDYLNDREENVEYVFVISKGNKIKVCELISSEEMYDYLVQEIRLHFNGRKTIRISMFYVICTICHKFFDNENNW